MDTQRLVRPMRALTVSFIVELLSIMILILLLNEESSHGLSPLEAGSALAIVVAGLVFYICLGTLASRLGKSWIVWVGLTVITKPIGSFVAYFMMRRHVKNAIEVPTVSGAP